PARPDMLTVPRGAPSRPQWSRRATVLLLVRLPALAQSAAARVATDRWVQATKLGMNAMGLKDYVEAEKHFRDAWKEAAHFGPKDARRAATLNNLGMSLRYRGKLPEAEARFREA